MEVKVGDIWEDAIGSQAKVKNIRYDGLGNKVVVYDSPNSGQRVESIDYFKKIYRSLSKDVSVQYNKGYTQGFKDGKYKNSEVKEQLNKEYVKGKTDGYSEGYQHGHEIAKESVAKLNEQQLLDSYNEGYTAATIHYNEMIEDSYEKGFLAAIEEMTEPFEDDSISFKDVFKITLTLGSVIKNTNNDLFEVKNLRGYGKGYYTVVLINRETREDFEVDFEGFEKEYSLLQVVDVSKQYVDGYHEGFKKKDFPLNVGYDSVLNKKNPNPHSHYFKSVKHLDYVDIYMVCKLFEVDDSSHCTQHSIKKLLMSGKRGAKNKLKDITEARDTLNRYLQILKESKEL